MGFLCGQGQREQRNEAKQVAMYLIRELCDQSLNEIAEVFLLGSHGSVGGTCIPPEGRVIPGTRALYADGSGHVLLNLW